MKTFYVTQKQFDELSTIEQDITPYRYERGGKDYITCEGDTCLLEVNEEEVQKLELKKKLYDNFMKREEALNLPTRRALLESNAPICNCGGRTKLINADALNTKNPSELTARWKCYKCKTKFLFEPEFRAAPEYMTKPNLPNEEQIARDKKIAIDLIDKEMNDYKFDGLDD